MVRVPKYYQVKNEILELITGLAPGAPIATERELAERFETSRTTVRQAIAELVVDGRLERTQGRGTFVAQPKLMQVRQLTSFSGDLQAQGQRPGSVMLRIDEQPADEEVSAHLEVALGTPIHRVERLRTAAHEPIAHEIAHLPGPLPDLANQLAAPRIPLPDPRRGLRDPTRLRRGRRRDGPGRPGGGVVARGGHRAADPAGAPDRSERRWAGRRVDAVGVPRRPVPVRRPAWAGGPGAGGLVAAVLWAARRHRGAVRACGWPVATTSGVSPQPARRL